MKGLSAIILITLIAIGCNTKLGSNEPTNDSKLNPAEMPIDTVGANTDVTETAATDSNKTGDPMRARGKSDLQTGGDDASKKAVSSDGNYVEEKTPVKK